MSLRRRGEKNHDYPDALPAFSTDTEEQARDLQVIVCKLNYDGRYVVPGFSAEVDRLGPLGGVEAINGVTDKLRGWYRRITERC